MKDLNLYYVARISRNTGRRQILAKYLTRDAAMTLVRAFPDSDRTMVVFYAHR